MEKDLAPSVLKCCGSSVGLHFATLVSPLQCCVLPPPAILSCLHKAFQAHPMSWGRSTCMQTASWRHQAAISLSYSLWSQPYMTCQPKQPLCVLSATSMGRGPCQARGVWWYIYIFFFCNHHGWIWSLACSLNHPSLRSSPDPTALWGKAENADSSASSSKREEQGRFPPGLAVTLPAQGSGVAFMMLLATLSQGWDELALHKQECHRQW